QEEVLASGSIEDLTAHREHSDGSEDSEPSGFLVRMSLSAHSGDLASNHVDDRESLAFNNIRSQS
ncbi:hypothetical protein MKX03_026780, partial [Papaver bracteatum]